MADLPAAELFRLYFRGLAAADHLRATGGPGIDFDAYGRALGRRLVDHGHRAGVALLINPVSIVRHFEFDFAWRHLAHCAGPMADVASPRLFALRMAEHGNATRIDHYNPDPADLAATRRIADAAAIPRLHTHARGVDALRDSAGLAALWSISVIEHIAGDYDDTHAAAWMFNALAPGGRLVLTFPVDRTPRDEFREADPYGTQRPTPDGRYFFQRWYTRETIHSRLAQAIGRDPTTVEYFGERHPGHLAQYSRHWAQHGLAATAEDPREIADHYQQYDHWQDMPGQGVAGALWVK